MLHGKMKGAMNDNAIPDRIRVCFRCGHCKTVLPIFEKVAEQIANDRSVGESSAVLAKVDLTAEKYLSGKRRLQRIDRNKRKPQCFFAADRFGVASFPTFRMFSKGKMYDYSG